MYLWYEEGQNKPKNQRHFLLQLIMNKNIYVALSCLLLLLLVSCNNSKDPIITTVKNQIQVKVYNAKTWNSQTSKMDSVIGATVYLISDSVTVTAITDNKGIATFSNVKEKNYYLISSKGNLSNLMNKDTVNSKVFGNLIIGIYRSQDDINSSAENSNAVVGGVKLADWNGDGRINNYDKVQGLPVDFKEKYKDINGDGIIDVKDLVNGSLIKLDSSIATSVFIGN